LLSGKILLLSGKILLLSGKILLLSGKILLLSGKILLYYLLKPHKSAYKIGAMGFSRCQDGGLTTKSFHLRNHQYDQNSNKTKKEATPIHSGCYAIKRVGIRPLCAALG
jgi:hypothetical protein